MMSGLLFRLQEAYKTWISSPSITSSPTPSSLPLLNWPTPPSSRPFDSSPLLRAQTKDTHSSNGLATSRAMLMLVSCSGIYTRIRLIWCRRHWGCEVQAPRGSCWSCQGCREELRKQFKIGMMAWVTKESWCLLKKVVRQVMLDCWLGMLHKDGIVELHRNRLICKTSFSLRLWPRPRLKNSRSFKSANFSFLILSSGLFASLLLNNGHSEKTASVYFIDIRFPVNVVYPFKETKMFTFDSRCKSFFEQVAKSICSQLEWWQSQITCKPSTAFP